MKHLIVSKALLECFKHAHIHGVLLTTLQDNLGSVNWDASISFRNFLSLPSARRNENQFIVIGYLQVTPMQLKRLFLTAKMDAISPSKSVKVVSFVKMVRLVRSL